MQDRRKIKLFHYAVSKDSMTFNLLINCVTAAMILLLSGCAGTPKKSAWLSPSTITLEQVYKAAIKAAAESEITVHNQDMAAGLISLKKEAHDGDETVVRSMSVKITQFGNKIKVSTKVSGSNAGIIEGTLGGTVHKEITRTFYTCLFRELGITDPNLQKVIIEDAL
jgi:hypothetical protein